MKLSATVNKASRNLHGILSPRAGSGGRVQDVTYDGESVVNEQGVAIIPPYPAIPEVPVKGVNVNGSSVVNEQGIANIVIPSTTPIQVINEDDYNELTPTEKLNKLFLVIGNYPNPEHNYYAYDYPNDGGTILVEYTNDLSFCTWYFLNVYITAPSIPVPQELEQFIKPVSLGVYRYAYGYNSLGAVSNVGGVANPSQGVFDIRLLTTDLSQFITGYFLGNVNMAITISGVQNNPLVNPLPTNKIIYNNVVFSSYQEEV